jgi:MFS family permease
MALVPLMAITMMVLYGIQGAYQPAVKASVPVLVGTEHIMKANSVVDVVNSAASMAGPVIGGLVFSILGLMPVLYISIGCFFASAVMEVFIHIPFEKRKATGNIVVTGFGDLKESFRFMFREQPALWKVSVIFGSSNLLLTALVMVGIPVIITGYLGFAPDTANRLYGYAQGVIAAGAVAGGLLAGVLSNRLRPRSGFVILLGCSLSVIIGGVALQMLSTPLGVYLVLLVGCGLLLTLHTLFQIQMLTVLQFLTPIDLIGKVVSVFICIVMATSPLGQLLYGFVFETLGSGVSTGSGSGSTGGSSLYLPFYAAGLVMIIISVLTRRVFSEIDRQIQE